VVDEEKEPSVFQLLTNLFVLHFCVIGQNIVQSFVFDALFPELPLNRFGCPEDAENISVWTCFIDRNHGVIMG
jgi:hypothetical protein